MDAKNIKYRLYGLFANMYVFTSALLISKDVYAKEIMDMKSMIATVLTIGLLYYLHKKLGHPS